MEWHDVFIRIAELANENIKLKAENANLKAELCKLQKQKDG